MRKMSMRLQAAQVAIYTMAGGGMVGGLHVRQPLDAYIDDRARDINQYGRRALAKALQHYVKLLRAEGFEPKNSFVEEGPALVALTHMGVW